MAAIGQELLNVPMGDMIRQMAFSIAEAQYQLDENSINVAEMMGGMHLDSSFKLLTTLVAAYIYAMYSTSVVHHFLKQEGVLSYLKQSFGLKNMLHMFLLFCRNHEKKSFS